MKKEQEKKEQEKQENQKQSTKNVNVLAFIFQNGKTCLPWMILAALSMLLGIVANFYVPQLIRFAVDSVIGSQPSALPGPLTHLVYALGGGSPQALLWASAGVSVLFVVAAGLMTFVSRTAMATGTERFCQHLRQRLFRHVQMLPFKWHVDNKTGDIIQRCTSDLDVVRNFLAGQILEVVRTFIMVGVALALMFSMNVWLTLVSLAFIPIISLYSIIFFRLVGKRFLVADEAEGDLTVAVQENLTGVRVVRAFGRERFELERFDEKNHRFANLWMKLGKILSVYWGVGDTASGFQIFTVVVVGAVFAAWGIITAGEYVVFVSYNATLAWPIRALGRVLSEMSKTGVSVGRLCEILDAQPEPPEPNAQKPSLCADIHFENVSFAYEQQPVLKDLSFTIPAGSTFGILGATGSGKSTITYLLNRLYDLPADGGAIKFGAVDVRDIDRRYLRRNVGLVLQEPFLFSKTIEENIAIASEDGAGEQTLDTPVYGRMGALMAEETELELDRERIRAAARVAAVDEAIGEFTGGYQTVVGERGVTLSGGQKQRVAIARTLMLNAPVMVFDDSMSAVDLETDAKIRAALREGTGNSTVILISHRINTLMKADRILVLEDGHMADLGTHAELIARDGPYKRIYDMQSEAAAEAGESLEVLGGAMQEHPGEGGIH